MSNNLFRNYLYTPPPTPYLLCTQHNLGWCVNRECLRIKGDFDGTASQGAGVREEVCGRKCEQLHVNFVNENNCNQNHNHDDLRDIGRVIRAIASSLDTPFRGTFGFVVVLRCSCLWWTFVGRRHDSLTPCYSPKES